jgi:hypothetical protein
VSATLIAADLQSLPVRPPTSGNARHLSLLVVWAAVNVAIKSNRALSLWLDATITEGHLERTSVAFVQLAGGVFCCQQCDRIKTCLASANVLRPVVHGSYGRRRCSHTRIRRQSLTPHDGRRTVCGMERMERTSGGTRR